MKALGEYLVEDGVLTPELLDRVIARQKELSASGTRRRFGDVVVEMGLGTTEQVQRAVQRQQHERSGA